MFEEKYKLWCEKAVNDPDLVSELNDMKDNGDAISDAFYKDLEFGTGGLRGVIGAGTNRMNVYTVGKASQGLAAYVNSVTKSGKVAIAYDSRIKSELFARTAASIFAANGIKVYIYKELMPTPMLSFAVRRLKCDAGVVVTASHNPAKYNGYKAYGPDGCQLGLEAADYVLSIMNKVDIFDDVKTTDFEKAVADGKIEYIGDDIINEYLDCVMACRVVPNADVSNLKVIYTPLHGSGNKPVRKILSKIGVTNVTVVPEQEKPDGNFPTAPYPNPEIRQAFECALKLAKDIKPDLLLATDPDCDRVGIAIPDKDEYKLFSGNDVGALLLDFVLSRRKENGTLPKNPIAVKTIVSTELCRKIADNYGCELIDVLTGFKFIGEQITELEKKGEESRYVFGFEESYGYLGGTYVRDKDAVIGSMLICEMVAFYKAQGKSLIDVLDGLYKKYGYYLCTQKSFTCEGESGMNQIKGIMTDLRSNPPTEINGHKVVKRDDYDVSVSYDTVTGNENKITLPKSNVLCYYMEDGSSLIVRPSGTEPKIKMYLGSVGKTMESSEKELSLLADAGTKLLGF
ncbi:MAG: phospho-sugar mutase [Acutalibacteraceae bacterium]|nr:phospho-sugar mutase [Clostridia bacterium]MEE1329978.1 phospho-sugar mutase [Acutalibacteraceae bacterium]